MGIKQIKAAWFLFKLAFKIRMMGPVKGRLYISAMRFNTGIDPNMEIYEKEALYRFLDQIEKGLDK